VVEHGAAAEKDITMIRITVAQLATTIGVQVHRISGDPPQPGLGILDGRGTCGHVQCRLQCARIG